MIVAAAAGTWHLGSPDIDWNDLQAWLRDRDPEEVIVALVHLAALSAVAYLLATAAIYVAASLLRVPVLLKGATAATPATVRRIVDGLLAIAVVLGPAATALPASASPSQATPPTVTYTPVPAGDLRNPIGVPAVDIVAIAHTVVAGESLWSIAESRAVATNPSATTADVTGYWRELVELNRGRIRSGDPDLIFPGEELLLPAADA